MSTPPASYLRLHIEPPPVAGPPALDNRPELTSLCRAFESATGWRLACQPEATSNRRQFAWSVPLNDGQREIGLLGLARASQDEVRREPIDTANASRLAGAIAELVNARLAAETALWQREAELASCVPVVSRTDEEEHLAQRLEAVLKAGADAIGCHAAAMYLLDADTTQLKLRSAWGLPRARLLDPPRLLASAIADLEALSGHAIVLEKAALAEVWNLPEPYPAAVCVPVSTPSVPLGTLWLFSEVERPFSDQELNLAEVIAGRLAVELERQMLLDEAQQTGELRRQLAKAHELQTANLQRPSPMLERWEMSGWALQSQQLGGAIYDWATLDGETPAALVAEAAGGGLPAALVAQGLQATLAALAEYSPRPAELLRRANQAMWRQSAGGQWAGLCLAAMDSHGRVTCTWAGSPAILYLQEQGFQLSYEPVQPLGMEPEISVSQRTFELKHGEALVLCTPSIARVMAQPGHRLNATTLGTMLVDHLGATAANLADLVRSCCESQAVDLDQADRGVVVIKRR